MFPTKKLSDFYNNQFTITLASLQYTTVRGCSMEYKYKLLCLHLLLKEELGAIYGLNTVKATEHVLYNNLEIKRG